VAESWKTFPRKENFSKEWNPRDKYFMFLIEISRKENVTIRVSVLLDLHGPFDITTLLPL